MKGYLSIGKVSKLKHVSIKSLRYYDEIGIFKPALTDHTTGYRYYRENQLYLLDAISLCVELGIPLKDMNQYKDVSGSPDLLRLLGDSKVIAENRIRSMYQKLEQLQSVIHAVENKQPLALPTGCHHRMLLSRTVLTIPFDEYTDMEHYNPKLLSLFVSAQRMGLAASYPSGLIYDYHNGKVTKYVFLHVAPLAENAAGDWGRQIEGLRTLPSGNYICHQSKGHTIEGAADIFALSAKELKNVTFIETDLLKEETEKTDMTFELQILA